MIYVIYAVSVLFILLSSTMLYVFYRQRDFGLLVMGVTYGVSGVLAIALPHWWPLAAVGSLFSRRVRRAAAVAAIADAAWEYARLRPGLDPLRFALARRLDDAAYGAGVWWGALRGRSIRALLPAITTRQRRS